MKKSFSIIYFICTFAHLHIYTSAISQNKKIDSLRNILQNSKEDTNKVNSILELTWQLIQVGDYNEAFTYSNKSISLSKKMGFDKGRMKAYNYLGYFYYTQGNYPDALKNYLEELKIIEKAGSKKDLARCFDNIGSVYDQQANSTEALKNYTEAIKIRQALGDKQGISDSYLNIGTSNVNAGNLEEGLNKIRLSLKLREEIGDKKGIANACNNLGAIAGMKGDYVESIKYFRRALDLEKEIGDNENLSVSYYNIGAALIGLKKFDEARDFLNSSFDLAKKIGYKDALQNVFFNLSCLDSAEGRYHAALEDYKSYILYRDSMINEENTKKSVRTQMNFDFSKKQAADSVKVAEGKKIAVAELNTEVNKRYSLYGGLILVLVFAIFIFNRFRVTQKQKVIIESQKELVEQQKIIVEEKNKDITDSIHYARRIQLALLPTEKYIERNLKRLLKRDKP